MNSQPESRSSNEKMKLCLTLQHFQEIPANYTITVAYSSLSQTTDVIEEVIKKVPELRSKKVANLELVEVLFSDGMSCKERCLQSDELPSLVQGLWPCSLQKNDVSSSHYKFVLRPKLSGRVYQPNITDTFERTGKYLTGLMTKRRIKDYPDLCNLPDLNESTLLENLKRRFENNSIYTYIGSILISINPFYYFPIYNPKFVEMYQNKRLIDLPPHIFAIADAAYHNMVTNKKNQCIVISGESGSGKTENSNFLLHHLSALSQRNFYSNGIEKHIAGVGPVLEAFGNAKTIHNNNSSRFGKFVQVSYREDGTVYGATVEKYLLEKSRIVSQAACERNYHVFYYLLAGASDIEKASLHLTKAEDYFYLNQDGLSHILGNELETQEFDRLKNATDAIGFSSEVQNRLFVVLSAILHIGNIQFRKRAELGHHDECVAVKNKEEISIVSNLLKVTESTLLEALTKRRTLAGGEVVVISNKMEEAISTRNATAKCLYSALFDWIVYKINTVLLSKYNARKTQGNCIGVLDIFGFEDFQFNSFEQFCINYANENLHYYFNQHIFKLEQEEYVKEGITWENIEFIDNTGCLDLFNKKPSGLLHLLDEESNFPGATNETLLSKFNSNHQGNLFYEVPQMKQSAFGIVHYAGKVKYSIQHFREKNIDLMRNDILTLFKSSKMNFMREIVGQDPVALMRWSLLRVFFKACYAFVDAGRKHRRNANNSKYRGVMMIQKKDEISEFNIPLSHASRHIYHSKPHVWKKKSPNFPMYKQSRSLVDSYNNYPASETYWNASSCVQKSLSCRSRTKFPNTMYGIQAAKDVMLRKTPLTSRNSKSKNKSPSISAQFHVSLMQLTETLNQATPSFIRCIKSNNDKAPKMFDEELVERQLRYTGMLATVKIRQSGYNYRLSFEDFVYHFHLLLPQGKESTKEDIKAYLNHLDIDKNNFQLGNSKVFLREVEKLYLEEKLHEALLMKIILIQNWLKAQHKRRLFLKFRRSTILIQSFVRCFLTRNQFKKTRISCTTIQSWYRGIREKNKFERFKIHCTAFQRFARIYLAQNRTITLVTEESKHLLPSKDSAQMIDNEQPVIVDNCLRKSLVIQCPHINDTPSFDAENRRRISYEMAYNFGKVASESRKERKSARDKNKAKSCGEFLDNFMSGARFTDIYESEVDSRLSSLDYLRADSSTSEFNRHPPSDTSMVIQSECERTMDETYKLPNSPPVSSATDDSFTFKQITSNPKLRTKSLSVSSQAGPEDLEIEIPQVVFHDETEGSLSDDNYILKCKSEAFLEKKIKAPLAVEEFFSDLVACDEYKPSYESKTISIDIDPQVVKEESSDSVDLKHEKVKNDKNNDQEGDQKPKQNSRKVSVKKSSHEQQPAVSSWSVSSTTQWKYPLDLIVENLKELRQLEHFLSQKMIYMGKLNKERGNKDSIYDEVFKASLTEFHSNLITQISTAKESTEMQFVYSYERLMKLIEDILKAKSRNKCSDDSLPFLINAFRGFLDEFIKKKENKELPDIKSRKLLKRPKRETITEHLGHKFLFIQFNIPTFCEMCQSLLWVLEKGYTCKVCKLTLHKKCFPKLTGKCGGSADNAALAARLGRTVIGSPLDVLAQDTPGGYKVHPVIEKLMNTIEMEGLYTEGLYRKPGMASAVKQLIKDINNDSYSIDFKDYPIHVLTAVLKTFFREMPEPLMTFDLYNDFIRFTDIEDETERIRAFYSLVDRLPQANHDLLERLIFHLAKVALQEESNRMTSSGLSIIFAPSILRTSQNLPMQESFLHIPRQSMCIQFMIQAQMHKMISTLRHIETINKNTIDVTDKLATLRASRRRMSVEELKAEFEVESSETVKTLTNQIKSLQRKKQELTEQLPSMSCRGSFCDDARFPDENESMTGLTEYFDEDSLMSSQSSDRISQFSDAEVIFT